MQKQVNAYYLLNYYSTITYNIMTVVNSLEGSNLPLVDKELNLKLQF